MEFRWAGGCHKPGRDRKKAGFIHGTQNAFSDDLLNGRAAVKAAFC